MIADAEKTRLALVILAAGESKRFGGIKQLADYQGKPLLQQVIDHSCNFSAVDLFLILGAHREEILNQINPMNATILDSPNWSQGMGATIASAVEQLQDEYDGLLFLAGDQPLIRRDQLNELISRWADNPQQIYCAQYGRTRGIPAIFPRFAYSELLALSGGDRGAKSILLNATSSVEAIEIPEAAVDIDQPFHLR